MRVIDYIKVDEPMPEDIPNTQYLYENGQHQFHYDKYERSKFNQRSEGQVIDLILD